MAITKKAYNEMNWIDPELPYQRLLLYMILQNTMSPVYSERICPKADISSENVICFAN